MEGRQTRYMNVGNLSDHTPLHLAASNGQDKVVKFLLDRGATIERWNITFNDVLIKRQYLAWVHQDRWI